jgi:sulfite exporter TauE/SafE
MCGALCFSGCSTQKKVTEYQLGRLISYLAVGIFFSILGVGFYVQSSKNLFWFLFFLVLVVGLITSLKYFGSLLNSWFFKFFKRLNPKGLAFVTGLISGLLPCGILHFIFGLVAFKSHLIVGLAIVLCFWFGTLPGFYWGAHYSQRFLKMNSKKFQMGLIGVCFFYAIFVYGYRASLKIPDQPTASQGLICHPGQIK